MYILILIYNRKGRYPLKKINRLGGHVYRCTAHTRAADSYTPPPSRFLYLSLIVFDIVLY